MLICFSTVWLLAFTLSTLLTLCLSDQRHKKPAVHNAAAPFMQGNCSEEPVSQEVSGVPLVSLTPGQCLLVTDKSLFYLGAGRLWMHNLYLRHTATQVGYSTVNLVGQANTKVEAQLWMTSCTLQGHGQYEGGFGASGLHLSSKVYVEGPLFATPTPPTHAV